MKHSAHRADEGKLPDRREVMHPDAAGDGHVVVVQHQLDVQALGHGGTVAGLEEWFDAQRLDRTPGHEFGLDLSAAVFDRDGALRADRRGDAL